MNFMQRLGMAWTLARRSFAHPADLAGVLELLVRSHQSSSGATVNPASAMRVAAVYSCVNVISETLAMLPLHVFKRKADGRGKDPAPDHPLMRLFKTPNPWQNRMEFMEMMATYCLLRGNAYALMIKTVNPKDVTKTIIRELLPLHPDCMRVEIGPDKLPVYFYTPPEKGGAKEIPISWEDIVHIRYKSLNGYLGLSPIAVARDVMGLGITLQDHTGNLFKNGAHIGGALEHPDTLTDEVAKRIRENWQETYGGALNSGKVLVLEEGMKFNRTGMTMQDAQYIDTKKLNRVEIASIYRVPPYKIGAYDKISYNSMEQAALEFLTDCLLPWCVRFELAFDRDLVRADDTYFCKFNVNAVLRADAKSQNEAFKIGREGGWLSVNDIRDVLDMNPVPDGDGYLQPSNFVPLGTKPPKEKPSTEVPPGGKEYAEMIADALKQAGVGSVSVLNEIKPDKIDLTVQERRGTLKLVRPVLNAAGKLEHFEVTDKGAQA